MRAMTPHEKECAFAAVAARIETAKTHKEAKEWRAFFKEIEAAPLIEDH